MRIDAHHHCWRYRAEDYPWIDDGMTVLRQDFGPAQLAPLLAAHGLDGAIVVQARHDVRETDWLIAQAAGEGGVRGVVGWLDVTAPDFAGALAGRRGIRGGLRLRLSVAADPAAGL